MQDQAPSARARFLASLIEAEGVPYGREDSFKMSSAGLVTQRFLLGVPLQGISPPRLAQLCVAMGMPQSCQASFQRHLADANLVFFGLEEDGDRSVYKVYLEFWDSVRQQVLRSRQRDPLLLHLGFKWAADGDGKDARTARYTCFPLLSVADILDRLAALYANGRASEAHAAASAIIQRAAAANPAAAFLYVEVGEEGNPRRSFDVNVYKAGLCVADIEAPLHRLAQHYRLQADRFQAWLGQVAARPLGHLAGGIDKAGEDFMTIYFETRAING
jgi:hypothetical protein